jgi:hypothetical protein
MGIQAGAAGVAAIYAGAAGVSKIYAGSDLVWSSGPPPPDPGVTYWFHADGGTNGVAPNTSDAYRDPWSAINVTTTQLVYAAGGRNGQCLSGPMQSASTHFLSWTHGTAQTSGVVGCWWKMSAAPSGEVRVWDFRQTSTSGTCGGLVCTTGGVFRVLDGTSGIVSGQSAAQPFDAWYWLTQSWDTAAQSTRFRVHGASGTLIHDSGAVAFANAIATFTTTRHGAISVSSSGTLSIDDVMFNVGSTTLLDPWLT